jgi:hypothetical protein
MSGPRLGTLSNNTRLGVPSLSIGLKLSNPKPGCREAVLQIFVKQMPPIDLQHQVDYSDIYNSHLLMPSLTLVSLLERYSIFDDEHASQVNPPYYVPLVEIVPAPWTDPEVVEKTKEIMLEIGQAPVVLRKETIGFALNRIQ